MWQCSFYDSACKVLCAIVKRLQQNPKSEKLWFNGKFSTKFQPLRVGFTSEKSWKFLVSFYKNFTMNRHRFKLSVFFVLSVHLSLSVRHVDGFYTQRQRYGKKNCNLFYLPHKPTYINWKYITQGKIVFLCYCLSSSHYSTPKSLFYLISTQSIFTDIIITAHKHCTWIWNDNDDHEYEENLSKDFFKPPNFDLISLLINESKVQFCDSDNSCKVTGSPFFP